MLSRTRRGVREDEEQSAHYNMLGQSPAGLPGAARSGGASAAAIAAMCLRATPSTVSSLAAGPHQPLHSLMRQLRTTAAHSTSHSTRRAPDGYIRSADGKNLCHQLDNAFILLAMPQLEALTRIADAPRAIPPAWASVLPFAPVSSLPLVFPLASLGHLLSSPQ
ncbi:hypothetical protein TYRP_018234 [Tyrophagus putrescentiae]|nr:hypothetical protein TYRP_018234 [Tyrophagus putrescentiae]